MMHFDGRTHNMLRSEWHYVWGGKLIKVEKVASVVLIHLFNDCMAVINMYVMTHPITTVDANRHFIGKKPMP